MPTTNNANGIQSLKQLNKYFVRYKWKLLWGILFVAISNIFAIFPAQLIRQAFDIVKETILTYQLAGNSIFKDDLLVNITFTLLIFAGLVIFTAIAKGFFMYLMRQTIIVMSRQIEFDLKNDVFEHYQKLSLAFYKRNQTGDLMNRISEDVSQVRMYIGPAIMYTINLLVLFVLVISTMINVNPQLTLFVLLPLPFLAIGIYVVSSIINKRSEEVQKQLSVLSSTAQETFSGIRVIKAFNREADQETMFKEDCEAYKSKSLHLVKVDAIFQPLMILLIGLSTIITVFVGGKLAIEGVVSVGNIAEFVIYVNMLTWPVASLGWVTSLVQRAAASQKRINEFLQQPSEIVNHTQAPIAIKGEINFENVSFTYADSGIQALKNISFSIESGKSLAVVGRTGSGKSTLVNLICRLYETTSGTIFIDQKPINTINLNALREAIGYVPQENFLFSDSIAQNIAFGEKNELDQALVEMAARDAAVFDNIMDFPAAFETVVGERGITLSGGQKQRITIARALIRKPNILLLDDCLSAVDTETEEEIVTNLKRIMQGKTSLIVSHRISSIKHCDAIIVLDEGQIIERGTHESLIAAQGFYAELHQKQLLEAEHPAL